MGICALCLPWRGYFAEKDYCIIAATLSLEISSREGIESGERCAVLLIHVNKRNTKQIFTPLNAQGEYIASWGIIRPVSRPKYFQIEHIHYREFLLSLLLSSCVLYSRILWVAAAARLRSMLRPRRKDGAVCGGGGGTRQQAWYLSWWRIRAGGRRHREGRVWTDKNHYSNANLSPYIQAQCQCRNGKKRNKKCQFIAQKGENKLRLLKDLFFVREDLLLKFLTKNRKFKEDGGHGNAGTRV